jgi:hypothetical protein
MHNVRTQHTLVGRTPATGTPSRRSLVTGRALSTIGAAFLLFDSIAKLLRVQPVLDGTAQLGYPTDVVFGLGVTLLLCVIAYIVPATSAVGALLLTGYLGGAVATHVRVGDPLFSHVLFPTYLATVLWAGLVLRDPRLRALLPRRGTQSGIEATLRRAA